MRLVRSLINLSGKRIKGGLIFFVAYAKYNRLFFFCSMSRTPSVGVMFIMHSSFEDFLHIGQRKGVLYAKNGVI
jgi:hypothetical protein